VNCKTIKEFRDDRIEKLQLQVARKLGFELLAHTLKMYGLCARCRRDPSVKPGKNLLSLHRG
jgi:Fur family ferric uptake transcriptional regulator